MRILLAHIDSLEELESKYVGNQVHSEESLHRFKQYKLADKMRSRIKKSIKEVVSAWAKENNALIDFSLIPEDLRKVSKF